MREQLLWGSWLGWMYRKASRIYEHMRIWVYEYMSIWVYAYMSIWVHTHTHTLYGNILRHWLFRMCLKHAWQRHVVCSVNTGRCFFFKTFRMCLKHEKKKWQRHVVCSVNTGRCFFSETKRFLRSTRGVLREFPQAFVPFFIFFLSYAWPWRVVCPQVTTGICSFICSFCFSNSDSHLCLFVFIFCTLGRDALCARR